MKMLIAKNGYASHFFSTVYMSGTPSTEMEKIHSLTDDNYKFYYSIGEAMIDNIICKPSFNLIHTNKESLNNNKTLLNIIYSVLENKKNKSTDSEYGIDRIKMIYNADGIDEAQNIYDEAQKYNDMKNIHFLVIHSKKTGIDEDSKIKKEYTAFVGNKHNKIDIDDPFDIINIVDNIDLKPVLKVIKDEDIDIKSANIIKELQNWEEDSKPIIIIQIGMISEGINTTSFNTCVINSKNYKTIIQQMGRVCRDFTKEVNGKYFHKFFHGSSDTYFTYDNEDDLKKIITALRRNGLKDFDFGSHIDMKTGSAPDNEEGFSIFSEIKFEPLSTKLIEKIYDIKERVIAASLISYKKDFFIQDEYYKFKKEISNLNSNELNDLFNKLNSNFKTKKDKNSNNKKHLNKNNVSTDLTIKEDSKNNHMDDLDKILLHIGEMLNVNYKKYKNIHGKMRNTSIMHSLRINKKLENIFEKMLNFFLQ